MKKNILLFSFLVMLLGTICMHATVTKFVPGDYATVAQAVTWLNAEGALTDNYVINVYADHTETLSARIELTATGTSSYSITIQKYGTGANPKLTAYVGTSTPGSAIPDGMFCLKGADYVTIDGIDLYDPNTTNPATMEYGYGLFKSSISDGAQYNTIKNCNVTLSRNNFASGTSPMVEGSVCILVINSTPTAATTALTPSVATGTNSFNKFYANTLSNANYGIALSGYAAASPFTLGDTGNDIGGNTVSTGNTIINYGGGSGSSNPSAGIRANNQWGINISYNQINNNDGNGVNHPSTLRGIYAQAGTSANCDINHNTITIKGGGTTSQLSAIECAIGSTAASNTVNVNYNTITNCTYTTATSGTFYGIYVSSTPAYTNINYNIVSNNSLAGTGSWYGIYNSNSTNTTTATINYNQIYSNSKTASGYMYCLRPNTAQTTANYNEIHDNTITSSGTASGNLYGLYNFGSPTVENYNNNQIYNLNIDGTSTSTSSTIYALYTSTTSSSIKTINKNQIYNIQYTASGAATIYGIYHSSGTTINIGQNLIHNFWAAGASSSVNGIYISSGINNNISNNMIWALNAAGSTSSVTNSVNGIRITGGTTNNVHFNTVFLNGTGTNSYYSTAALYISSGTTNEIRNNIFKNVSTPGVNGYTVAIWKTTAGTSNLGSNSNKNIYYSGEPGEHNIIAYINSVGYRTLQDYKNLLVDRDQGSYTEDVQFISEEDLHINPDIATRVESNAVAILGCDIDIDDEDRSDTNPDIGADEGDFTLVIAAPEAPIYVSPTNGASGVDIYTPLVWSANSEGGTPTNYDVYFSEDSDPAYFDNVLTTTCNPPKQYSKTYYWKVVAKNDQGSAEGVIWSFTTMADPNFYVTADSPYLMDFEEITTAGELPQGWTKAGTKWNTATTTGTYNRAPRSGTDYATCGYSATTSDWLFSRPLYLDATKNYDFGIWYNTDGYTGWTSFKMYIGNSATGSAMTTELASVSNPINTSYMQLTKTAWQPNTSGSYVVGLQVIATSSPWYMSFDDFSVSETPLNPVFTINPTSKDFGLKQVYTQTDQLFTISNTGQGTLTISDIQYEGDNCFSVINLPQFPVNLTAGQNTTFIVRYIPTTTGDFSGQVKITDNLAEKSLRTVSVTGSAFDPILPLPYTQDFNASTNFPANWTQSTSQWSIGSSHGRTGNGIYKNIWSSATNAWFQTQPIGPITEHTKLSFYYRLVNYSSYPSTAFIPGTGDNIKIWVSTDAGTTFTQYGEINSSNHTPTINWTEKSIWLSGMKASAGDRIILKFEANWGSGDWFIDIDDIEVKDVPANPVFSITPESKAFGELQINTVSAPQVFTIKNDGGGTLIINPAVELTGTNADQFQLTDTNSYPCNLGPDQTITVSVAFAPTSLGEKTASLKIVDNLSKTEHNIPLTGTGVDYTIYVPYLNDFQSDINGWTILDVNNDGKKWTLTYEISPNKAMKIVYNSSLAMDDWLIAPPISLTKDTTYDIKYEYRVQSTSFPENLGVYIGNSPTPAALTNLLNDHPGITNTTFSLGQATFTPQTTGIYYIGFHGYSDADMYNLYVDNFRITFTNSEIVSGTASDEGIANLDPPPINNPVTGNPLDTSLTITGITGTPTITATVAWAPPTVNLPNVGLVFTLSATSSLAGVNVTFTHNLGFIPDQIAYRIIPGTYTLLNDPNDGSWTTTTFTMVIPSGKADGDFEVVFPSEDNQTLPVTLSNFTAVVTSENFVNIAWMAETETNHSGYNIFRNETKDLENAIKINAQLIDKGTAVGTQISYFYTDFEVYTNMMYYYWLESVALDGTSQFYGPLTVTIGDPAQEPLPPVVPMVTKLYNAFPNPFNPNTNIRYSLKEVGKVKIEIYNMKGQKIKTFTQEHNSPGYYQVSWDGRDENGRSVASGIYLYRLTTANYTSAKKMVLAK